MDNILKCIFMIEKVFIMFPISLKSIFSTGPLA